MIFNSSIITLSWFILLISVRFAYHVESHFPHHEHHEIDHHLSEHHQQIIETTRGLAGLIKSKMNAKKGFKITGCKAKTPSLARRRRMEKILDDFRKSMFSQFTKDSSEEGSLERNGDFSLMNNPVAIDVYFHNIYNGANKVGYLSDNKIQKQMKILNENFSGSQTTNPNDCHGAQKNGVDTQISFQLKTISRTASSSWYSCFQRNEMKIKQSLRKGNCSTLNIYTADLGGALGFAYFPDVCRNNVVRDGVVIDYRTLPGGSFGKYNLGNTLAHEVSSRCSSSIIKNEILHLTYETQFQQIILLFCRLVTG